MHRSMWVLALGLLGLAAPVAAQQVFVYPESYYGYGSDTAFIVPSGKTAYLKLYGGVSGGVGAYSVTVFVDTARLRIVSVDSVPGYGLPKPTVVREAADRIRLSASGTGYGFAGAELARIGVLAVPGASTGSLFSVRVNSWVTQAGASVDVRTIQTDIENGCIAYNLWGDPDSSLSVTGRDALITLTSAVGLPVTGFNLDVANVDDDGEVTSRDALLILARAIDPYGYYYSYYRAGLPIAGRCAPLAGVPSDFAFMRGNVAGNLYRVPAGDSVAVAVGSPLEFYYPQPLRWAPDGTKILGTVSTSPYGYEPVAVTLATLAHDTLARTVNGVFDGGGAYSPSGTSIAFFSDRQSPYLWRMNADGTGQVQAQTAVTAVTQYTSSNPAWSPDGQRIAFVGYQSCCAQGLWSVRVDSQTVRLEFPISLSYQPSNPVWSPAGDSIAFVVGGRLSAVKAPDTTTVPQPAVRVVGTVNFPSWTSAGILFRWDRTSSSPGTYDYYLRRPDGRILRVYRATGYEAVGGSFR